MFHMFIDGKLAFHPQFTVLIHHTMDATLLHRLGVMDMLRRELSIFLENQFYAEKSHPNSNY